LKEQENKKKTNYQKAIVGQIQQDLERKSRELDMDEREKKWNWSGLQAYEEGVLDVKNKVIPGFNRYEPLKREGKNDPLK